MCAASAKHAISCSVWGMDLAEVMRSHQRVTAASAVSHATLYTPSHEQSMWYVSVPFRHSGMVRQGTRVDTQSLRADLA